MTPGKNWTVCFVSAARTERTDELARVLCFGGIEPNSSAFWITSTCYLQKNTGRPKQNGIPRLK